MKVAVIGTGFWGKNHVREYCNMGHDVVACDLNKESLEEIKKAFPVKHATTSIEEVLKDREIRAVSICVPNQFHFETAKKAIAAGKNVLLEKPMTLDSKQCKKLIELARKKNVVLTVGHIFRFNNAVKKLKEMVQKGDFGKIYTCKLVWTNLERIFPDRDILFDLAPHPFDIVNFVLGKNPQEVYAIGKDFRREGGEEAAFVNAILDGILVNLEISWITPEKRRTITLVGEKKTAFVDALTQKFEVFDIQTQERKELPVTASNALVEELKTFINCIESGAESSASGRAGYEVVFIIEKTLQSLHKKKIVKI